ncbi:hypothetical protein BCD67_22830 [Oscillatoriales cyanobacterium USR001]|nr:hypothetical protein BCD67_22830 [Oscillatoriales cyanobacterium USR001]
MTSAVEKTKARRGRIFPDRNWSPERMAKERADRAAFNQQCRAIFDRVKPELIADHYNWFIIIEPESGDYFIDADENFAVQKARQSCPNKKMLTFRINETGTCGKI